VSTVKLARYEQAERDLAHDEARIGLMVHGVITALVSIGLVVINITVAPEFPWSAFAVGGMVIGFAAHWWFGSQRLDEQLTTQQRKVEARAARLP
jgi:2TM domain